MKLRNLFNVALFSFIMIVPLVPTKVKILMFPMAADFILGTILIGIGFLCIIEMYIKKQKISMHFKEGRIKFLSVVIVLFVLMCLYSVTYASHKSAALMETLRFLEYVFIFFQIIILTDRETIDRGLKIFYFTMVFASLFGICQFLFNWSSFTAGGFFGKGRIYSTFVNPNYWGAAVNTVIFYPLIGMIEENKNKRIFHIATFLLFFLNLFFSSTRGSWIGFACGVIIICLLRYRRKILYFIVLLGAMLAIPMTRSRFLQMFNIEERLQLWKTGYYMFRDNFWRGVGNGNYIFKYQSYIKKYKELDLGKPKFSVHNSYIKMFAELGIFGGILFIAVYVGLFAIVYRVYSLSKRYGLYALAFLGFAGAYLFQNFFNNLVFIPQLNVFVWIITALLFKGLYLERQGE